MTINSAVLVGIIPLNVCKLIKLYIIYLFCIINELLIWFKIKAIDNCFNFCWE